MNEHQDPAANGKDFFEMTEEDNEKSGPNTNAESAVDEKAQLIAQLEQNLEAAKKEAKDNFDKYLRAMADMQNQQRRQEKEKQDLRNFVMEGFFSDVIPVLDSLEKALQHEASPELTPILSGIELVQKQLQDTMQKFGMETIRCVGEKFNPNIHQAIQKVESAETDSEVVKEQYSTGYTLNGRLLRPAMVLVEVPKSGENVNES